MGTHGRNAEICKECERRVDCLVSGHVNYSIYLTAYLEGDQIDECSFNFNCCPGEADFILLKVAKLVEECIAKMPSNWKEV